MKKLHIAVIALLTAVSLCGCGGGDVQTSGEAEVKEEKKSVEETITITCAGDCTLGTDSAFGGITLPVEVENQNGDYSYFLKNVQPYFSTDDLTIVNFEGTLTDRGSREQKTFAFKGDPEYTKILTEGSVEAVTLANNHSKDYGDVSMEDTQMYLDEAGVIWFENLTTRVVDVKGVKVGLIGLYALNGTAEGNLPKAMEQVKKDGADVIIVQVHWGIEGDNYPDGSQVSLAHDAIDSGADLVIGHHPHVLQGVEKYKGKMIAYSLGNFCFGGNQNPSDKDTMIFRQTFTVKDGEITDSEYEIIPCSISSVSSRNNYQPTPAEGSEKERISAKIEKFSANLGSDDEEMVMSLDDSDEEKTVEPDEKKSEKTEKKEDKKEDKKEKDEPIEDNESMVL